MHPARLTLPCLVLLAMVLPDPLPAQSAAKATAPKPRMGSTVFEWNDLKTKVTPNGERRDVANDPTATLAVFECHITTLNPGRASHAPHRHAQEELIIVKEGTLEVHIEGQTQNAGPGSVFFYASNDAHAVRNVGDTRATYWVVNLASSVTQDPARHTANPKLRSGVYDWAKLTAVPTKNGSRRALFSGSTVTLNNLSVHATTVNGHEAAHGAHRHPDEELVILREGTMEVTVNGQARQVGPGSLLFFASNDLHGMRNAGPEPMTYYVIRMVTADTPPAK